MYITEYHQSFILRKSIHFNIRDIPMPIAELFLMFTYSGILLFSTI